MKKTLAILVLAMAGSQAFALHETNCSNADGSIKRVEKEIWGANPVVYTVDGQVVSADKVTMDESTKSVLVGQDTRGRAGGGREIYTILMKVENGREDFVICNSWWNSAID